MQTLIPNQSLIQRNDAASGQQQQAGSSHWAAETVFYHIYPLGLTGAPAQRWDPDPAIGSRLDQLLDWIPYWQALGIGALWLGPIHASMRHGYDPVDYFRIDPRLGDAADFARLSAALHDAGIRVVLDGVFNHVGRDFFAFVELLRDPDHSAYRDWFHLRPGSSPFGDPFGYDCWEGHHELVRLNLSHPGVRDYLFAAVSHWIADFGIDGLRLDVAYCLDPDFVAALTAHCRRLKPDFWLMGEIIHGDYRPLLKSLDSVSNYECHKGLWSSHKDRNCFELAHSLERLFARGGLCEGRALYNFADNHDVDRVASRFEEPEILLPLYLLLMGMPGIPSLYHGSELGLDGRKLGGDDRPLRPALAAAQVRQAARHHALWPWLQHLIRVRSELPALHLGDYATVATRPEQLAFSRSLTGQVCLVAANLSREPVSLPLGELAAGVYRDALDADYQIHLSSGARVDLPASGGRILVRQHESP